MFHFRDSLLEHVLGVNEGTDTAMVKQLALALADLALLMHAEWPTAVQDLANQVKWSLELRFLLRLTFIRTKSLKALHWKRLRLQS